MAGQRVTIGMIAARAGVSKMSVSRCLRGHSNNSKATQAKVRRIAREMGYVPNPMIASLMVDIRSRQAKDYATVIGILDDYQGKRPPAYQVSWEEHIEGMRLRANELGYKLEVFRYREQKWSERTLSRILHARNVRGLIIPYQLSIVDLRAADLSNCSCVSLGYTLNEPDFHRVCPDFSEGMRLALLRLREFGYQRPAFVTTANNYARTKSLFLSSYLADRFFAGDTPRVLTLENDELNIGSVTIPWLKSVNADSVISTVHLLVGELRTAGYQLGSDMGYVQLKWSEVSEGVAGVKNSNRLQGILAVNLVNASILSNDYGVPKEAFVHLVKNEWVPGHTLAPRSASVR